MALGEINVLEEEKGQAHEVVSVKVADEDHLKACQGHLQSLQVREKSGRGVEEIAAVGEKPTPVAPSLGESVAGAEKGQF